MILAASFTLFVSIYASPLDGSTNPDNLQAINGTALQANRPWTGQVIVLRLHKNLTKLMYFPRVPFLVSGLHGRYSINCAGGHVYEIDNPNSQFPQISINRIITHATADLLQEPTSLIGSLPYGGYVYLSAEGMPGWDNPRLKIKISSFHLRYLTHDIAATLLRNGLWVYMSYAADWWGPTDCMVYQIQYVANRFAGELPTATISLQMAL